MTENEMLGASRILSRRLTQLTGGASSSLPAETAETALRSILYTAERGKASAGKAPAGGAAAGGTQEVAAVSADDFEARYDRGLELVKRDLSEAKKLLTRLRVCRFKTRNIAFNDTLDHGAVEFFGAYDPYFAAHEPCGIIDYPLAVPVSDERGAYGALMYLRGFEAENRFLCMFDPACVDALMQKNSPEFADDLVNLASPVMQSAACLALMGKSPASLSVSPVLAEEFSLRALKLPRDAFAAQFTAAMDALISTRGFPATTRDYLATAAEQIARDIYDTLAASGSAFVQV